jgi:hypothetical protein
MDGARNSRAGSIPGYSPDRLSARHLRISFGLYVFVAVGAWLSLPSRGFWINDQGVKELQIEAINSSPDRSSALRFPYPPEETGGILPYTMEYLCRVKGRYYFIFSDTFPRIAAFVQRLGGEAARRALPLAAGLLAVGFWVLAGRSHDARSAPWVPLVVLASPWMFYHWVLWEHTLALLAQTLALWLCLEGWKRRRPGLLIAAGAALGLGAFLRLELLAFAAAAVLGFGLAGRDLRRPLWLALGVAFPALALAVYNLALWGHPLGVHYLANTGEPGGSLLAERFRIVKALVIGLEDHPWIAVLAVAGVVGMVALSASRRASLVWTGWILGLGAALAARLAFLEQKDPFLALSEFQSLITLAPILLVGAAIPFLRAGGELRKALGLTAGLFFLLGAVACPKTAAQGIHWGPRMLLPGLVPMTLLAAGRVAGLGSGESGGLERTGGERAAPPRGPSARRLRIAFLCALAIGLFDTGLSCSLLRRQETHNGAVERFLDGRPESFIATNLWWVPQLYARLSRSHSFFFITREEDGPRFRRFAKSKGQAAYLVVTDEALPDEPGIERLRIPGAPDRGTVVDARFYSVRVPR